MEFESRDCGVASYKLQIEIKATRERVWEALIEQTNAWWLPDFRMTGEGSIVTFNTYAGGGLVEQHESGSSLLWYTVHWYRPDQFAVHLVGEIAPDWGGPSASHLKLSVVECDNDREHAVFHLADAHYGHIDAANLKSLHAGWTQLFTDGLKRFVEEGV